MTHTDTRKGIYKTQDWRNIKTSIPEIITSHFGAMNSPSLQPTPEKPDTDIQ
jgi:hypothetical protein